MPDYSRGKVYAAMHKELMYEGLIYVGHTTMKYLSQRKKQHVSAYNFPQKGKKHCEGTTINALFREYGPDDVILVLLEDYPCENVDQIKAKEEYWRLKLKTVNKSRCIPPTEEEVRAANREKTKRWVAAHPEEAKAASKKWKEENPDKVKEYNKKKYQEDPEKAKERMKKWKEENPDKVKEWKQKANEKRSIKFTCGCGGSTCERHTVEHEKTKKHQKWLLHPEESARNPLECSACGKLFKLKDSVTRHKKNSCKGNK